MIFKSIWMLGHYLKVLFRALLNELMHPYGCRFKILCSPLEYWTPKKFMIPHFGHPLLKSWLRPKKKVFGSYYILKKYR